MLRTSMKRLDYRFFVLLTVITGCAASSFSEDLDASLDAQKKKAQRHVYSESALLHDQNLVVPREASAEEKDLDKKLEAMEAEQSAQAAAKPFVKGRPGTATVALPTENQNWLTAAILDKDAAMSTNATEDAWLARELERQKELKAQETVGKENALVEKLLREKTQQQSSSPELERLKQYQLAPQKLFGSRDKDSDIPSYMTPRSGTPDPLATIRPKKETPVAPPLFSPEAARLSSALEKDPLRSTRSPALNPNFGAPAKKSSSSPVFSPNWSEPEPVVLTPMEMIRKASPINRQNPFMDDHMPKIKTSIWE